MGKIEIEIPYQLMELGMNRGVKPLEMQVPIGQPSRL